MKKVTKFFTNIKSEEKWLAMQKGWKLIHTNGLRYTFAECSCEYNYEYIYFEKSKKELDDIKRQIVDSDIEFVCNTGSWALFRKDASKGELHVYADNYLKYKILMKKYKSYMALGACYICLGSSQTALASTVNSLFRLSSILFYLCSIMFFIGASSFKKYSSEYDNGSYDDRMRNGE